MTEVIDGLAQLIYNKGVIIGFLAGFTKGVYHMRAGSFIWYAVLGDIVLATLTGYTVYEFANESKILASWQVYLLTLMLSLNAFLVVGLLLDPTKFWALLKLLIWRDKEAFNELARGDVNDGKGRQ